MPVRWKIFLALNFILSIPAFICLILLAVNFFSTYRSSYDDNYIPILGMVGFMVISFNGFLNVYILQRYYPDKLISPAVRTLNVLSLIFNILTAIGNLILCIYGARVEFNNNNNYKSEGSTGKIVLLFLFIALLIHIIIITMQGILPGIINRNNHRNIDSLIDSIGE